MDIFMVNESGMYADITLQPLSVNTITKCQTSTFRHGRLHDETLIKLCQKLFKQLRLMNIFQHILKISF